MLQQLSWRDPAGYVFGDGDRLFRAVGMNHVLHVEQLLASTWLQAHMQAGRVSRSWWLKSGPVSHSAPSGMRAQWLEHERVEFPGFPHEITALQLYDAAKLTLTLAVDALNNGWILKDGTAWNVLYGASRPIFCDLLSFEPLGPAPTWDGYAQFQRCFTIPLLLYKLRKIPPRTWFLSEREGVAPEAARPLVSGVTSWTQPALEAITLPTMFSRRGAGVDAASRKPALPTNQADVRRHVLRSTLERLDRHIDSVKPVSRSSNWSRYRDTRDHYSDTDLRSKESHVRAALSSPGIRTVLDLGCNTGEYSNLAAGLGKSVVAIDSDDECVQRLYASTRGSSAAITSLVLNIARPTPGLGWLNSEVPAFLDRAKGHFDCVLALGLVHHLLVTERAPLSHVADLFNRLVGRVLVVEWIDSEDPRFRELASSNLALYDNTTRAAFEAALSSFFRLTSSLQLPDRRTRTLYTWTR
jgi:SAM-dependent methyltransferase